jgi:hypothetical protein
VPPLDPVSFSWRMFDGVVVGVITRSEVAPEEVAFTLESEKRVLSPGFKFAMSARMM